MSGQPTPSPARTWLVRVGLVLLLGYHAVVVGSRTVRSDRAVSGIDSATYVQLSQALAEGKGYVEPYTPGHPPYTVAPPLFPALLALIRLAGGGIASFYAFVLACSLLGLLFAWLYLRPLLGEGWALSVVAATALTPLFLQYSARLMTEASFFAMLFGTLLLVRRSAASSSTWSVVTAGLAIGMTTMLKSVGLALLPAAAIHAWRSWPAGNRRWARVLLLVVLMSLPFALWVVRNRWHGVSGGTTYVAFASQRDPYDLDQGTARAGDYASRVWRNLEFYCQEVTRLCAFDFPARMPQAAARLGFALVPVIAVLGAFLPRSTRRDPSTPFVGVCLGILLVWPWNGLRFLLPIVPFLLAYVFLGVRTIAEACARRTPWVLALIGTVLLIAWFFPRVSRHAWAVDYYLRDARSEVETRLRAWLDAHVAKEDVLLCWCAPSTALATGHECVEYERTRDPRALDRVLERYQVRWVLVSHPDMARDIEPQLERDPSRFPLVHEEGPIRLYSVGSP